MLQEKEINSQDCGLSKEDYDEISELDSDWTEQDEAVPFEQEFHYGLYLMESTEENYTVADKPLFKTLKYDPGTRDFDAYSIWPIDQNYLEYKEVKKAFDYCTTELTLDQIGKLARGFKGVFDPTKHYMLGIFRDEHEDYYPATLFDTFDLEVK